MDDNKPDLLKRLEKIDGFGWKCGQPLKDKGSYMRCGCGCSQPSGDDLDHGLTVKRPAILGELEMVLGYMEDLNRLLGRERVEMEMERDAARMEFLWLVVLIKLDKFDQFNGVSRTKGEAWEFCQTQPVQDEFRLQADSLGWGYLFDKVRHA